MTVEPRTKSAPSGMTLSEFDTRPRAQREVARRTEHHAALLSTRHRPHDLYAHHVSHTTLPAACAHRAQKTSHSNRAPVLRSLSSSLVTAHHTTPDTTPLSARVHTYTVLSLCCLSHLRASLILPSLLRFTLRSTSAPSGPCRSLEAYRSRPRSPRSSCSSGGASSRNRWRSCCSTTR